MFIHRTIGNKELWQREKTLFLTSRQAPIGCYGKVFQWVEGFDRFNDCAVCFNTSEFEEEVLKALLVCHVPTTLVVTGRFHDNYNVQIEQALKENRLLILVLQPEESAICHRPSTAYRLRIHQPQRQYLRSAGRTKQHYPLARQGRHPHGRRAGSKAIPLDGG